jgi:antitoxin VapB
MSKTAKLFRNGNSQAVRLPQEFRFPGGEVRIRREGDAVVLEPIIASTKEWFAAIDRYSGSGAFEGDWRNQRKAREESAFEGADGLSSGHKRLRRNTPQQAALRKRSR